ncbi:hypothetical protein ON010_g616 [Phytophthora cinnamomi]|nr:hypothetical protein ON010_g616 [Phytophthora cinnamomi]
MTFQARWRELKKVGWHSRKPAGLSVDFTYLKPGKTKRDKRGEDYFVGEEELMKFLDKLDICMRASREWLPKKKARREGSANAARRRSAMHRVANNPTTSSDEPVRSDASVPSAAVASFDGKAVTPDAPKPPAATKTAPPPAAAPPTSQTLPAPAIPASQIPPAALGPDIPPGLNMCPMYADDRSESSHNPADDSDDDDTTSAGDAGEESKGVPSINVATGDANHVDASEDPRAYVAFESDAENDDGDDENDAPEDDFTELDVQLPVPPELRFDSNLVAAVGGMENIVSGTVSDELLREMGEKGWSELATSAPYDYLMQPYEDRPANSLSQDYPNLYTGESGPTPKALDAAETPSGAFFYFLQSDLWEDIAAE